MICHFLTFESTDAAARLGGDEAARLLAVLRSMPKLRKALIHTPATTHDPYLHDGHPPLLTLQLYFPRIEDLEAALAPAGTLQELADAAKFPSLAGAESSQQAMLTRIFPVPDPRFRTKPGAPHCSYLVAYHGAADDHNAWFSHYVANHPPIMARFPGIREIEIYSRLDWCGFLPFPRVDHMQRNKVVFDDADALTAALNSPVRHEMRADFAKFPPFTGRNSHYPMATRTVMP